MGSVWPRSLALVLPAVAVVGLAVGWTALDATALRAGVRETVWTEARLLPALRTWRARRRPQAIEPVALFGDSVAGMPGFSPLAAGIQQALGEHGIHTDVLAVVHWAFRATQFYYLLDEVLAGRPQLVAVEVNPRAFSAAWARRADWRFAGLSRFLSLRRALRVRPALAADEVSLLDPLLYGLEDAVGALDLADGIRARAALALDSAGEAAGARLGLARSAAGDPRVADARLPLDVPRALAWYGGEPAAQPTAGVLRAVVRELRAAGVTVVLYVTPVNVERLAALGLDEVVALPRKLEALRVAVGAAPEEWLDLHASAAEGEFADATEHLTAPATARVAGRVAAALDARRHSAPSR
jgi:hypothetical protein